MPPNMSGESPLARLEDWYGTPFGIEVAARESACVSSMLTDVFGYYLIQVGVSERYREALGASRIRHRILMPSQGSTGHSGLQIIADPSQLPLATDMVDAVVLPHTLDFAPDPRQVLREVERVLIPEGRVFVVGFNALSSWGLLGLLYRRRGRMPWCGRFLTPHRVEDWLSLLGFDVEMREHIMFRPPIRHVLVEQLSALDTIGRWLWPGLGGVYVVRAVKRVSTLTPLKPKWARPRTLLPGAIEPTTRNGLSNRARHGGGVDDVTGVRDD